MTQPDLFVGKEPVTFDFNGGPVFIGPNVVVRAGHPIMAGRESLFEPLRVHYDVEPPQPVRADDTAALREKAAALGVKVDGRWSPERLREEIAKASQPKSPPVAGESKSIR
jgi:hypothetical protein